MKTNGELRELLVLVHHDGRKQKMTFWVHPDVRAARLATMIGIEMAPAQTFARMSTEELRAWGAPLQVSQLSREAAAALVGELCTRAV